MCVGGKWVFSPLEARLDECLSVNVCACNKRILVVVQRILNTQKQILSDFLTK